MGKICTFFGHRNTPDKIFPKLKDQIFTLITKQNVDTFWIGGHGNFDWLACKAINSLKDIFPNIKIIFVVAYLQQIHNKFEGQSPFDNFDYPLEAQICPRRFAISARNRYMAQNTDFVITYIKLKAGGAYDAAKIARNSLKTIINLI